VGAFKQAIKIKPDFAKAYFNLGITYVVLGDKDSALDQYKILEKIDKDLANKLFSKISKFKSENP
jgi:tetratricopeptide (TPR) repeat protein